MQMMWHVHTNMFTLICFFFFLFFFFSSWHSVRLHISPGVHKEDSFISSSLCPGARESCSRHWSNWLLTWRSSKSHFSNPLTASSLPLLTSYEAHMHSSTLLYLAGMFTSKVANRDVEIVMRASCNISLTFLAYTSKKAPILYTLLC